jgi:hypothetical protein
VIVRKQRRLMVRMGQYETHEVIAEVTVDTSNPDDVALIADYEEDPTGATAEFLDDALFEIMRDDVEEAHMNTSDEDSFIHDYHDSSHQKRK